MKKYETASHIIRCDANSNPQKMNLDKKNVHKNRYDDCLLLVLGIKILQKTLFFVYHCKKDIIEMD